MPPTETATVDAVRMTKMAALRSKLDELESEIVTLAEKEILDADEEGRFEDLCAERDATLPEYKKLEVRAARVQEIQQTTYREIHGMPEIRKPAEEYFGRDVRTMDWREARDGALRLLGDNESSRSLSPHQVDNLDKIVRNVGKTDIARRIIVTENDAYRSMFLKMTTDPNGGAKLTDQERQALQAYEQYRTQDEATTHGGFALPVFIDPSVILTDQELDNPFLRVASIVDVNTNAWKGVSAAGVSWSFDAEMAEVSDDSITLAQPSVTVYTARGFVPFSLEVAQDWPGFEAEMAGLLAKGYDDLLLNKLTTGNGTTEPRGLLTALVAQTTTETTVTTDGAFGQEDIYKVWKTLPQKYRQRASWMMSVGVMNKIRQFGASNVYHATTVTLVEGAVENLFNKPVYENAYMPDFTGTTGSANIAVVGDFSGYKIARRQGIAVELVPHLFATANNLPSGTRGWFAHARIGGNVVNNASLQVLVNT